MQFSVSVPFNIVRSFLFIVSWWRHLCSGSFATQMFQLPAVIINTIAATRIYRSLADYTFGSTDMYSILRFHSSPALIIVDGSLCSSLNAGSSKTDTKVSKMKWNNRASTPLKRIEVAMDTTYERYPTSQTTLSVGAQQSDRPQLSTVSDVENAVEIGVA